MELISVLNGFNVYKCLTLRTKSTYYSVELEVSAKSYPKILDLGGSD
jgi:hypothetical protein